MRSGGTRFSRAPTSNLSRAFASRQANRPSTRPSQLLRAAMVLGVLVVPVMRAAPLQAQSSAAAPTAPKSAAAASPVTPAQAQQLLDVLNDPARRAAFTTNLATMAKTLPVTASPAPASAAHANPAVANPGVANPALANPAPATAASASGKIVLAPNSLGSDLLEEIGSARTLAAAQVSNFGRMFSDMVLVAHWLHNAVRDPQSRSVLLDAAWRCALVFLVGLLAERGLALLLRRPLRALARDSVALQEAAHDTPEDTSGALSDKPADAAKRAKDAGHRAQTLRLLRRVPFALMRLVLKLLPVGLFVAIGNIAAGSFDQQPQTELTTITMANLYGIGRLLYLVLDMLLAPSAPGVRLAGMTDATARLLMQWWAWLVAIPVVAFIITDVGGVLDLPRGAAQSLIRAIVLVEHVLVALLIWKIRRRVAAALSPPRQFRTTAAGIMLSRMADHWWIPALFFNFALWVIWAAQVHDGYGRMWRLFLTTCAVIFACRLTAAALLGALERLFRVHPEFEQRYPGLERRANRYYPVLRRVVNWMMLGVGAVLVLQSWGIPALAWFTSGALGTRLVSALLSIFTAMIIGVVVWEVANAALDRQISRFGRASQTARAVRLQTLLPILRTILFILLATVIGLTVLSAIGVNVAPLLAGAGILGVAIGFGSQKLVQDFITGIFLLVENTMQVGDTVTAAGLTGTVEHLSIRTLRLRGGDGSVQIIPFSSVSTVINLSRDYAVAAIAVSVAIEEDTDRVCKVLQAIGEALRKDDAFGPLIVEGFALNGIDSIGEYAVAISGTVKCTVDGRWPVQREFYRRLRAALDEQHIALPARKLSFPGLGTCTGPDLPMDPETAHG